MITRRRAIAMLPAGLMMSSNFINLARAQSEGPAVKPLPETANQILSKFNDLQLTGTPFYPATAPMIKFFGRLASLGDKVSKSELRDLLQNLDEINSTVDTVLVTDKKTDKIFEAERNSSPTQFTNKQKFDLMTEIKDIHQIVKQTLSKYFDGSGNFESSVFSKKDDDKKNLANLKQRADDLLGKGNLLSNSGKDAFFAAARGYAAYQFVTGVIKTSFSPQLTARANTIGIIVESQIYLAFQAAYSSSTAPPQPPSSSPSTSDAKFEFEKETVKRFPREIYFGSEKGNFNNPNCPDPEKFVNYFGKIDGDFDQNSPSFRMAESNAWTATCGALNNRGSGALSDHWSYEFGNFSPRGGDSDSLMATFKNMIKALNAKADQIKRDRDQRAGNLSGSQPKPPEITDKDKPDFQAEFKAMERMAWGLREILVKT